MLFKFWESKDLGFCLIEREDGKFYVTPMISWYRTSQGRAALLPFTKGWGTDAPEDHDIDACELLGQIDVPDSVMGKGDRDILQRCINKEGFDYAMLHYSNYESVNYNKVYDLPFKEKLKTLKDAYEDLQMYLKLQDVDVD